MRSITLLSLSALLAQATARNLEENQSDDENGSLDKLADDVVDKLIDRVIQMPVHDANLDETTLAKTAPGATMGKVTPNLVPTPLASFRSPTLKNFGTRDVSNGAYSQMVPDVDSMMKVPVYDLNKNAVGETTLDKSIFGLQARGDILHDIVTWQMANWRTGSANTKTRAEVRGSTKKLRRQKGTGMARVGDAQSPIRRGGGVAFGPKPEAQGGRKWSFKLNDKHVKLGLRMALSDKLQGGEATIISSVKRPDGEDHPLTKTAAKELKNFGEGKFFILDGDTQVDKGWQTATKNLPLVKSYPQRAANVYDIMNANHLLITEDGLKSLQERLKKYGPDA